MAYTAFKASLQIVSIICFLKTSLAAVCHQVTLSFFSFSEFIQEYI